MKVKKILLNPKLIYILSFLTAIFLLGFEVFFIYILADWMSYLLWILLIIGVGLTLAGVFIWLGIKVAKSYDKMKKSFLKIAGVVSLVTLIALPFSGLGVLHSSLFVSVDQRYFWNDGPWISFGSDPTTEITISWLTAQPQITQFDFGESPDTLDHITLNQERSYLHNVKFTNLTPNTRYFYRIDVNFDAEHENTTFSFKTAPQSVGAFSCIIIGDVQPSPGKTLHAGKLIAQRIHAEEPDFVLQLGDLTYSGGSLLGWHYTLENFPLYAANAPFQAVVGNHDYTGDGEVNFRKVFSFPYVSTTGLYYSFDYGNAHFIMIDNFNSKNSTMTDTQKLWVEQDLLNSKTRGVEWIFVAFHHTIFTTATSGQDYDLQEWMVPLADKYDVDGVFFGHDHHYEHWNYTYGNQGLLFNATDSPSENETHYWMSGNGGADLEIDYGLLTHGTMTNEREFYNVSKGEYQMVEINRIAWNKSLYFENTNPEFSTYYRNNRIYYHDPDIQSYSSDNALFGYDYGEDTWNYMKIEMNTDGKSCIISAHYPNGDLLTGPNGIKPQIWHFFK